MTGGGSGGGQQVSQTSGPSPQVMQAYTNLVNAASATAQQPLNLYSGEMVAGFSPQQQAGFQTIDDSQGIGLPFINSAAQMYGAATTPLWEGLPQFDTSSLPGTALGAYGNVGLLANAASSRANQNDVSPFTGAAANSIGAAMQQAGGIGAAVAPYTGAASDAAGTVSGQAQSLPGVVAPYTGAASSQVGNVGNIANSLPGSVAPYTGAAGSQAGNVANAAGALPGSISKFTNSASGPINLPGYNTLPTYFNPYQDAVTKATQNLFDQQNAQQLAQVRGDATSRNAYGGDRTAVAEALTSQQQQLAEAPVLAQIQQQGFAQAQQEYNQEKQTELARQQAERNLSLGAGQLATQAGIGAGQLGLGAGQLNLGAGQLGLGAGTSAGQLGLGAGQLSLGAGQLGLGAGTSAGQLGLGAGQLNLGAGQLTQSTGLGAGNLAVGAGGLGVNAGQLFNASNLGSAQLSLGAGQLMAGTGQGLFNEFNQQQQQKLAADQANAWLASQAGAGLAGLGNMAQQQALTGAQAQIGAGALQQQLAQNQLNIPYQQFVQTQAYPYQQLGFLAPIIEGTGSLAGGTGSTTYPGPSTLSQLGGLGLAGAGIYGLGSQQGWWGSGTPGNVASDGIANPLGDVMANLPGGGLDSLGFPLSKRGGRIGRAEGGGLGRIAEHVPDIPGIGSGVPVIDLSYIPQGAPGGIPSKSGLSPFQPVTTQTSSGGGGDVLGGIGQAAGIVGTGLKIASFFGLKNGGRADFDQGGDARPDYMWTKRDDAPLAGLGYAIHRGHERPAAELPISPFGNPTWTLQGWRSGLDNPPIWDGPAATHVDTTRIPEDRLDAGEGLWARGGRIDLDQGGTAAAPASGGIGVPAIPQINLDYIIHPGPAVKGGGPPKAPSASPGQLDQGLTPQSAQSGVDTMKKITSMFDDHDAARKDGGGIGHYDAGGAAGLGSSVPLSASVAYGGEPPTVSTTYQQLMQLPLNRLMEMQVQYPPTTQQGQLITRVIAMKQASPGAGTVPATMDAQPQGGIGQGGGAQPALPTAGIANSLQEYGGTAHTMAAGGAADGPGFVTEDELDPHPIVDHSGETVKIRYPSEGKVLDLGLPSMKPERLRRAAGGTAAFGYPTGQPNFSWGMAPNGVAIPQINPLMFSTTKNTLPPPGQGIGNWFNPLQQYKPPGAGPFGPGGSMIFPQTAAYTPQLGAIQTALVPGRTADPFAGGPVPGNSGSSASASSGSSSGIGSDALASLFTTPDVFPETGSGGGKRGGNVQHFDEGGDVGSDLEPAKRAPMLSNMGSDIIMNWSPSFPDAGLGLPANQSREAPEIARAKTFTSPFGSGEDFFTAASKRIRGMYDEPAPKMPNEPAQTYQPAFTPKAEVPVAGGAIGRAAREEGAPLIDAPERISAPPPPPERKFGTGLGNLAEPGTYAGGIGVAAPEPMAEPLPQAPTARAASEQSAPVTPSIPAPVAAAPVAAPKPSAAPPAAPPSPKAPVAAPQAPWMAVGDSIANGYIQNGKLGGTGIAMKTMPGADKADAAGGRTPQEVLDSILIRPDGYYAGKPVLLSTGVSNDPSQIGLVPKQFEALQKKGAGQIQVAGVGNRAGIEAGKQYDLRQYNPMIEGYAQEAQKKGADVRFGGPLPAVVHPGTDYYPASARMLGNAPQVQISGEPVGANGIDPNRPPTTPEGGKKYGPVATALVTEADRQGVPQSLVLKAAQIESGMGTNNGTRGNVLQLGRPEWQAIGGGDMSDPATQARNGVAWLKKSQGEAQQALGRAPEDWETYVVHQQGSAGGTALLRAPAGANAVDVLAPAYGGNRQTAMQAITANGGSLSMTAGQFRDYIHDRFEGLGSRLNVGADWGVSGGRGGGGPDEVVGSDRSRPRGTISEAPPVQQASDIARTALANTPPEHRSGMSEWMNSPWFLAFLAGAGMLASKSPFPGVALGEGLQQAAKGAEAVQTLNNRREIADIRTQHSNDLTTIRTQQTAEKAANNTQMMQYRYDALQQKVDSGNATLAQKQQAMELSAALNAAKMEQQRTRDEALAQYRQDALKRPTGQMAVLQALMGDENDPNRPKTVQEAMGVVNGTKQSPAAQARLNLALETQARIWAEQDQRAFQLDPRNIGRSFDSRGAYQKHLDELRGGLNSPVPGVQPPSPGLGGAQAPSGAAPAATPAAPAKPDVVQNGVLYRWNGNEYAGVQRVQ